MSRGREVAVRLTPAQIEALIEAVEFRLAGELDEYESGLDAHRAQRSLEAAGKRLRSAVTS